MEEPLTISIRLLNPHIVCSLCAGYLIDATTITECLHTYCKSCIVKYLQLSKCCPQCSLKIHETMPLMSLRPDRTMQDVVYKIVPGLYENEERRKQEFYKSRGLVKPKAKNEDDVAPPPLTSVYDDPRGHYYRHDEQISLCIEPYSYVKAKDNPCARSLPKKFVRCSVRTCVFHVQQLLRKKLMVPSTHRVDIICNEQLLPGNMTLKHVWLSVWVPKLSPMVLNFRAVQRSPSASWPPRWMNVLFSNHVVPS